MQKLLRIVSKTYIALFIGAFALLMVTSAFEGAGVDRHLLRMIARFGIWAFWGGSGCMMVVGYFGFQRSARFTDFEMWMFIFAHVSFLILMALLLLRPFGSGAIVS